MAYFRCTGNSGGSLKLRTAQGEIASFETNLPEPYPSVTVNVLATGGNGTPDNPIPINGYTEANIVNTQNDSIVDLFSIDSDFRGTVAFNQLVQNGNFESTANWSTYVASISASDNVLSFTATSQYGSVIQTMTALNTTHKYLAKCEVKLTTATPDVRFGLGEGYLIVNARTTSTTEWQTLSLIFVGTGSKVRVSDYRKSDWDLIKVRNVVLIDLTQMFGSTIADYIYTLEQNNAGAGVAFFRNIYPEDYYAYDSGTTEIVGKETPEAAIAFGQTVYGGVLDVTRGKLHVTWGIVDLGTLTYTPATSLSGLAGHYRYNVSVSDMATTKDFDKWICSGLQRITYDEARQGEFGIISGYWQDNVIRIESNIDNETDFKNSMNGIMLAYELATPFDIDLTPTQIRALVGENNVFADCGETEVKYLYLE